MVLLAVALNFFSIFSNEEQAYLTFIEDITHDIIDRGIYSDR